MQRLETEMSQRFPELATQIVEHHDLPYVIMAALAHWLETVPESGVPAALERVRSFVTWCEQQSRSEDPGEDIFTILVIGFFEKLLESEALRCFVPVFLTRDDLERDPNYWTTWVGEENYAKALALFTATT
ncbi:MAG: hypothetical protein QOE26_2449 [Verrucomicrobiota bacterium]|jgi:hypothetical protein